MFIHANCSGGTFSKFEIGYIVRDVKCDDFVFVRVHPKPTLGTARKLKIEKSTGFEFDLVKAAKLHVDNKE